MLNLFFLSSLCADVAFAENAKAPTFTLRDINGKQHALEDYKGQIVLLNFWATWCGPCQSEMPHLQKLQDELGEQGFKVLSISIDESKDISKVKPIIKRNRYTFTVLLDRDTKVAPMYNPDLTLPYNALIDHNGDIVWTKLSYAPGEEVELRNKVLEALELKKSEVEK
jgi:peroxiredoxin